jgi:paraquat-inducible protein B
MGVKYDVLARGEEYTDRDGQQRVRWHNCGVVMDTKSGGLALKLESLPTKFDGWLTLAEPKPREEKAPASRPQAKRANLSDDDIPFAPRDHARGDLW